MNRKNILLSVIIATYNSEKTLTKVLDSVQSQTLSSEKFEILIVDGGSSDSTLNIAKDHKCKIFKNTETNPVAGKLLGYQKAQGKYIMYLDHDELIDKNTSLEVKLSALSSNPNVKAVAGGNYVNPPNYPFINQYINEFGDPFSFFMYRISKRNRIFYENMKERYDCDKETNKYGIFSFIYVINYPIIELVAGGSMFDAEFLKRKYPNTLNTQSLLPHLFYLICKTNPFLVVLKNDPYIHYSSDSFKRYIRKISWRVRNNIYLKDSLGSSGYTGREEYSGNFWKFKKYLFIPYSLLILPVLSDALYLSFKRKDSRYLLHILLSIITAAMIIYHAILNISGAKFNLKVYGS